MKSLALAILAAGVFGLVACGGNGDNFAVYPNPQQSGAYYNAIMADGPALYWRLDEPSNQFQVADVSGNGHHGVYENDSGGGVTPDQTSLLANDTDPAVGFGGATHLSARIRAVGYQPFVQGSQRTFECWVNRTADETAFATIFASRGNNGVLGDNSTLELLDGAVVTQVQWYADVAAEFPFGQIWTNASVTLATTHHIVFTVDDATGTAELFVDGVSKGQKVDAARHLRADGGGDFQIGSRGWSGSREVLLGTVDEVAVYERILAPSEVWDHFVLGSGAPATAHQAPPARASH